MTTKTNQTCTNCGLPHELPACPECSVDANEIAQILCGILDPCCREDALDEIDMLANVMGHPIELDVDNHGASEFTLTLGGAQYKIAITRTR
jgi:hypothetical protein